VSPEPPKRKRRARSKAGKSKDGAPPPSPRRPRDKTQRAKSIAVWVAGGAALLLGLGAAALLVAYPLVPGPGVGRDVEIVLPGDESAEALSARLSAAGLVAHPRLFTLYLKLSSGARRAVRGPHLVADDLSPRALLARLERSTLAGRAHVTIPEGWTRFDIARRLQQLHVTPAHAFLEATSDPDLLHDLRLDGLTSAEGFLFPATYDLALDSDARDVARRMKSEFDHRWSQAEGKHGSSLLDLGNSLGWGMRQIVILASMVEKEAVVDDERALIASVFVNRLRDPGFTPKILQCDPTAGYGCLAMPEQIPSCANYTGKITHDIVADAANPYNTYKHEGLPPGPIANPGLKSLEAAMAPASTRWLYFVARGDGRSTFSETYGAHSSAVHRGSAPPPVPAASATAPLPAGP
jgi:UPF0755 protein